MNRRHERGFTLLEMMIVTEIIAVLAAMAIPVLLRQRIQANEAAAVQNLRTISTAQISFNTVNLRYGTFEELSTSTGPGGTSYLDGLWQQNVVRNEYIYTMDQGQNEFQAVAAPKRPGSTGLRIFTVDTSGRITYETAPLGG